MGSQPGFTLSHLPGRGAQMNERMEPAPTRQPVMYVPHGGGPWPFVDMRGFMAERDIEALRAHRRYDQRRSLEQVLPRTRDDRHEALRRRSGGMVVRQAWLRAARIFV
jgi:hypothetical protein